MHPDLALFRSFYDSRLGTVARRMVRRRLRALWPDVRGQCVLGFGYATPYLGPFVDEAASVIALMPSGQGAAHWPRGGRNRVALSEEAELPLADGSVDRVLVIHGLETSEVWRALLRQIWRVLTPSGRVIIVAPNRTGLWATSGRTPFGHGHPYTRAQLERLLHEAMFTPERWEMALYGPPVQARLLTGAGKVWERTGRALYPRFGGLLIVEASKSMYAPAGGAASARVRAPVRAAVQRS